MSRAFPSSSFRFAVTFGWGMEEFTWASISSAVRFLTWAAFVFLSPFTQEINRLLPR